MTDPVLRAYRRQDQPGFAALVDAVHAEFGYAHDPELDRDLDRPEDFYRRIWVLRQGTDVVGTAALTAPCDGRATLKRMYVRSDHRGRGWGRVLLTAAIDAAPREGCRWIDLDTGAHQRAARRLYERAGFEASGRDGATRFYTMDLGR